MAEAGSDRFEADGLSVAWRLLTLEDKAEYWDYATTEVQNYRPPKSRPDPHHSFYDGLCAAIYDLDAGARPKARVVGLPVARKRLSAAELQKSVRRLKERLFEHPHAQKFLRNVFCRWVQYTKTTTLLQVLDALGCEHDEVGTRTGSIPNLDPALATRIALQLADSVGAYNVLTVCAALTLNHEGWEPLSVALPTLAHLAKAPVQSAVNPPPVDASSAAAEQRLSPWQSIREPDIVPPNQSPPDEAIANTAKPDPVAAIEAARAQTLELTKQLNMALVELASGLLPNPEASLQVWTRLESQRLMLCELLSVETRQLGDFSAAIEASKWHLVYREPITKLLALEHRSDRSYKAHLIAVQDAHRAHELLGGTRTAEFDGLIGPLMSLLTLVEHGDELGETEAAVHDEAVRSAYGGQLAVSAQRRKLAVRAPGIVEEASIQEPPATDGTAVTAGGKGPLELAGEPQGAPQTEMEPVHSEEAEAPAAYPTVRPSEDIPNEDAPEDSRSFNAGPAPEDDLLQDVDGTDIANVGSSAGLTEDSPRSEGVPPLPFAKSFSEFRSMAWINSKGKVEAAPWTQPLFAQKVAGASALAWSTGRYGVAYLLATGAERLGSQVPNLDITDLRAADRVFNQSSDFTTIRDESRSRRLRVGATGDQAVSALTIALEAIAPNLPATWSSDEAQSLCERAGISSGPLQSSLVFLLGGWSAAFDPIAAIRGAIKSAPVSPEQLQLQVKSAQADLQRVVATLWNAGGGRIVHTHCKKAWTSFVQDHVAPLRDAIAPTSGKSKGAELSLEAAQLRVAKLASAFQWTMNSAGVKHGDRVSAQRAAEQIVVAVERVVEAKSQLELSRRRSAPPIAIPSREIEVLLRELPSSPSDRLCTLLVRAALSPSAQTNPLKLPASYLRRLPDLLRALSPQTVADPDLVHGIPVDAFSDVRLASALIVLAPEEPTAFSSTSEVLDHLRDICIERDRADLLSALVQAECLQPHEKTQLHRRALELGDQAYRTIRAIDSVLTGCDDMLSPQSRTFRALIDEAYKAYSYTAGENPIADTLLHQAWLDRGLLEARSELDAITVTRIDEATRSSRVDVEAFKRLAATGNYRSAMALFQPDQGEVSEVTDSPRTTMWRSEALKRFSNPRSALVGELKGVNFGSLVSYWVAPGEKAPYEQDVIRKAFYNIVSGEAGYTLEANKRRFGGRMVELRQHKERKTIVQCSVLRDYLQSAKLNPTFLPQLAEYDQIVISSLLAPSQAAAAVESYISAAKSESLRTLSIFLEPGLSVARRDEIVGSLRRKQVAIAIVDDIDVCRLCAIGIDAKAHNFIPLIEIALEQLDLELASPFSNLDGQHIRLESFVGRANNAEAIARNGEYSRVFSGRKLGKSAFLRFLASKYDGARLPSGKDLKVLFISIAGLSSESSVVDTVIGEMNRRAELHWESEANSLQGSVTRFKKYIERYCSARRDDNVLVILDEADAFIEDQLLQYESRRDKSLSFYMMKSMPGSEGGDMPRIRFLFAGYRVTNTRGGVWANAGDVLILKPLAGDEATQFLRGMLGRIGVDIGSHAQFAARRCGYQPAVLIRFGDAMLRRLKRNLRTNLREHYEVTYDDVIATMSDASVVEEIRTVVNNNFQGNRAAAAVFAATLLALKDVEPGMALEGGQQRVLNKLSQVDSDTSWLAGQGADPLAQVDRQLQEFIERGLLTAADGPRFGVREYRLNFPHFMSVLEMQDLNFEIRQHIQYLKSKDAPSRLVESVLPDASLEAVRYVYREGEVAECSAVVAAGLWADALTHPRVGLADRLGHGPKAIAAVNTASEVVSKLATYRIFGGVSAEMLEVLLATPHSKPLVLMGGVDLLRAALRRQLEGADYSIDVRPLMPLSRAAVDWWFVGARALHFRSATEIDMLFNLTSGVPILVQALSDEISNLPSTDVTPVDLTAAIERFSRKLPSLAEQLVCDDTKTRLTTRELDLLRMIRRVAKEVQEDFDLVKELPLAWEMCSMGEQPAPFQDEQDGVSLRLLLCMGLLPAARETAVEPAGSLGKVSFAGQTSLKVLLDALGPPGAA